MINSNLLCETTVVYSYKVRGVGWGKSRKFLFFGLISCICFSNQIYYKKFENKYDSILYVEHFNKYILDNSCR